VDITRELLHAPSQAASMMGGRLKISGVPPAIIIWPVTYVSPFQKKVNKKTGLPFPLTDETKNR